MPFDWYPGHMRTARREIAKAMPSKDVILEVVDARLPLSSTNPVLTELAKGKPRIKFLSKADLADAQVTEAWLRYFEAEDPSGKVIAVAGTKDSPAATRGRIVELCRRLAPHRRGPTKDVRVMLVGIPNAGKSTLLNTLLNRKVAKVSDQPGVTRAEQLVTLKGGVTVSDNPGVLWPKMDDARALRLALAGAIPDVALDYTSVGFFAAECFLAGYPELVRSRYKLDEMPASPAALLEAIGRRHGGLRKGGEVDVQRAGDVLVHDFRQGALGRITLERPEDWAHRDEEPALEGDAPAQ